MDQSLLSFFLTGGVVLSNPHPNPAPHWLTEKSWNEIVKAGGLDVLKNLHESVASNIHKWKSFYDQPSPEEETFPEPYGNVDDFLYLILLKTIRPDKIVHAVKKFIVNNMGRAFVEPPPFDLQSSFADSNPFTPLVFILSPGSDPMDNLMMFAKEHNMSEK